jgi:hypothetical protein
LSWTFLGISGAGIPVAHPTPFPIDVIIVRRNAIIIAPYRL